MIEIRPTILEVPPEKIENTLAELAPLVKSLHLDVGDGLFIPRKTSFDPQFTRWVKNKYDFFIDLHLMVQNPLTLVKDYADSGAEIISFHFESSSRVGEVIEEIKRQNKKVCLALKLETSLDKSKPYWDSLEEILLMSVDPGFGGQGFKEEVLPRIQELRKMGWQGKIKIDGGVRVVVARKAVQAGANILVAGTALFESGNIEEAYQRLVNDSKV